MIKICVLDRHEYPISKFLGIFLCMFFSFMSIGQDEKGKSVLKSSLYDSIYNPVEIESDVIIANYFKFIDSLVVVGDSLLNYPISEHILVHHNPRVIDTLANTDYYRMIEKDSFVYDQRKLVALPKNSLLKIPDSTAACGIQRDLESIRIEVNIPEYKLRIYRDTVILFTFPVRVGQNKKKYLAMGDRITDLRTKHGKGRIVRHVRNPDFYNPVDGKQFYLTKRDDGKTTLMPQIPWLETEINGVRNGQMIHPTTNLKTLGKAYSNGCIGTKEADGWIIYYYAPLGTPIEIKYDLNVRGGKRGKRLENIYGYGNKE